MDLSKYFFLGHIIDNLHDLNQKLNEEIIQNPGIIWDLPGFAGRYGQSNSNICDKMQEIYTGFETEVRNWMTAPVSSGSGTALPDQELVFTESGWKHRKSG